MPAVGLRPLSVATIITISYNINPFMLLDKGYCLSIYLKNYDGGVLGRHGGFKTIIIKNSFELVYYFAGTAKIEQNIYCHNF